MVGSMLSLESCSEGLRVTRRVDSAVSPLNYYENIESRVLEGRSDFLLVEGQQ